VADTIPSASISYDEKISRPMGSKQAKRRKISAESIVEMAAAVVPIADSQKRRVIEPRRRNKISLMQSENVPISVRKELFPKMAAEVMASFDARTFFWRTMNP
jgi:hypothetical protein